MALRHLELIEANGSMKLIESLAIRRELYGAKVESTANLFGQKHSGALFYQSGPQGRTAHAQWRRRIAKAWRALQEESRGEM